ncbi:hypothetical protein H7U19_01325 [Hyunsoonleella sp. SJ7]|uniref:histidine kinase n=1 Tax=Hyunsoonleella aquatilis TaxID=2762758 RepID=A0A923KFX2_9FLAO|nr:tetratricopeptide repeat-containing sensor histidine kinase [Hyunsoonleella aquatilis]MBC3757026.1 hypothetical protein [Hyunsoonleella aquatilis]
MKYFVFSLVFLIVLKSFGQRDKVGEIMFYNTQIDSLIKVFDYNSARELLHSSSQLANEIQVDSISAIVYEAHAKYYYYTSDYQKTAKYLIASAEIYDKIGAKNKAIRMYNNIAAILGALGQYQKALNTRKKILEYNEIEDDLGFKISVLSNIGSDYRKLNLNDSSFNYLKNALKVSKENKLNPLIGAIYKKIQKAYLELNQYHLSIKYGDSVLIYKDEIERPLYENSIIDAAQALFKIQNYEGALQKCQLAETLISESKMLINLPMVYQLMSSIYEQKKQYKKANSLLKRRIVIRDSLLSEEKQRQIIELEQKYQTEKKEKENFRLKKESVEKDLKLIRKNNVLLVVSLVFGVVVAFLVLYQLIKFKSKNKALQNEMDRREEVERSLGVVRDNIAKDFHDDLGNKLARITVLSDHMVQSQTTKTKEEAISALKKIKLDSDILYKGTRDFMFSIKANSDYAEELFTYLSDFGEDFFESFPIDFFVEKHLHRNIKLPYYWNRQIIMIFKEAMTNTAKYSNASKAVLRLSLKANFLEISFDDNGVGFNEERVSDKNGLANMKLRADKILGRLEIISGSEGTKIVFSSRMPLNYKLNT